MNLDQKTKKQIKPWLIIMSFCAFLVLILFNLDRITAFMSKLLILSSAFIYAIIFAYILNLPMSWFEKRLKTNISKKSWLYKKIRPLSIFITVLLALLIVSVLLSIIVPQLIDNALLLSNNLVTYIVNIADTINNLLLQLNFEDELININPTTISEYIESITGDWQSILQSATSWVGDVSEFIVRNALSVTVVAGNILMGFMMSLYLLGSKETLIRQSRKIIVATFSNEITIKIFDVFTKANEIFSSYISGQLLENCILGFLIYFGMSIFQLGTGYEVLIAVVVSIFSIVPIVGAVLAMLFGFLLILATDPVEAVIFVIFYQIVQQIETSLIYPNVVGKSVGLPAIWTLLSIIIFGGLFGFIGMLIAVPTTALIYTLIRDLVHWRLNEKKCTVTDTTFTYENESEQ